VIIKLKVKEASTFLERLFGLLNPDNPKIMLFRTRFGIHTFFMKNSIDVLLLDDDFLVVKTIRSLSPFKIFVYNPKYSRVIEMPKGAIDKLRIGINDKISIR
jgi:uncharacterized membrane protein (UPF0127 family)